MYSAGEIFWVYKKEQPPGHVPAVVIELGDISAAKAAL